MDGGLLWNFWFSWHGFGYLFCFAARIQNWIWTTDGCIVPVSVSGRASPSSPAITSGDKRLSDYWSIFRTFIFHLNPGFIMSLLSISVVIPKCWVFMQSSILFSISCFKSWLFHHSVSLQCTKVDQLPPRLWTHPMSSYLTPLISGLACAGLSFFSCEHYVQLIQYWIVA